MNKRELVSVTLFVLGLIMIAASSIPAKATGKPHAEYVTLKPSILDFCWIIYDENNKAVGGNCR